MKIKTPSLTIAVVLSMAFALVCYLVAPETDNRQWIALGISFFSIFCVFAPAISFDYEKGRRNVSIKLMAWLGVVSVITSNILFSVSNSQIDTYVIVTFLIVAVIDAIVYAIYKS